MLYFQIMKSPRVYWLRWAEQLRRYQLHELTAAILESAGALNLIGAQALYIGGALIAKDQLSALAQTLEDEDETRAFAAFLTSERNS